MTVYIDNVLKQANFLSVSNMEPVYIPESLYDPILSNSILCTGTSTTILAQWNPNVFADSIAVLDCNWTIGHLTIVSQGETVYDEDIISQGKHTVIKLPKIVMLTSLNLSIEAMDKLSIGILWAGVKTKLPLFTIGFSYKDNIISKAERTMYGIAYGVKRTPLKSFEISFQDISNEDRLAMEDYIETVQFVDPHLVEPYEAGEFPPIYATLEDSGGFDKQKNRFRWDGFSLSYREAK
jgi:hypothetical protein